MKAFHHRLIEHFGAQYIIEHTLPFVSDRRQQRIQEVIASRLKGIQLAIEAPSDINNALATVRSSEAFGITDVHIIAPEHTAGSLRRITRGTFHWIEIHYHDNLSAFLAHLNSQQIALAGAIMQSPLSISEVPVDKPICLLLGNEHRGLSQNALSHCDHTYKIPMQGMAESLNVSVTGAISVYETTQRRRVALAQSSDLSTEDSQVLTAKYHLHSVSPRMVAARFQIP